MAGATAVDDLKLKASYGTQGNDGLPNNKPYQDQYQVVSNGGAIGINYVFRGNKQITWEKSHNFNTGVEFKFWNRLSGGIEFFMKDTYDLLYSKPLPPSAGVPGSIYENTMSMRNSGVELELFYDVFKNREFNWSINLNATHYKNQLTSLPADRPQDGWDGHVGFVPAYVKELNLDTNKVALICGPPIMIKFVLAGLKELGFTDEQIYTTFELRMKCGIGKCGRCNIGSKYVCKDGPVFRYDEIGELPPEY